jgi:hypothetical protein
LLCTRCVLVSACILGRPCLGSLALVLAGSHRLMPCACLALSKLLLDAVGLIAIKKLLRPPVPSDSSEKHSRPKIFITIPHTFF